MLRRAIWAPLAGVTAVLLGLSVPAHAATGVAKVSNGPAGAGEAGYFINDNGQTRIRDVQFDTQAVNTLENLNGTGTGTGTGAEPGGVGGELCDENTGFAAQIGLEWPAGATAPVVEYNYTGNTALGPAVAALTANSAQSDQDPCVEGGLLNAGTGEQFANAIKVQPGDLLHFEIYYNPRGHWAYSLGTGWAWLHQVKFLVSDLTQDLTRVQYAYIPTQNFHEAGIGVVSMATNLTGGAVNLVNTFTGTFFNWYWNRYGAQYAPQGILQQSHWDLEYADFVNGSNQVTLTPSALSSGNTAFSEFEGSTSA